MKVKILVERDDEVGKLEELSFTKLHKGGLREVANHDSALPKYYQIVLKYNNRLIIIIIALLARGRIMNPSCTCTHLHSNPAWSSRVGSGSRIMCSKYNLS